MTFEKFIICSDIHGDKQDPSAVAAFFKFNALWKAKHRILAGDLWDFRPLRKGASPEEKLEGMIADKKAGFEFADKFKPTVFIRGNHDERIYELAGGTQGIINDYAMQCVGDIETHFAKVNCPLIPYSVHEVYRLGHMKVIHGFNTGIYAARNAALVYGGVIMGHTHSIDYYSIPGLERRAGRIIGCLCELKMPYASRHMATLRQAHGWAYGYVNPKTGAYYCFQAEKIDERWFHPMDL